MRVISTIGVVSEEWITTSDAAELSEYHPEHIRRLIRDGTITGKKFGIVWQVSLSSIQEYLEAMKQAGQKRGAKPKK